MTRLQKTDALVIVDLQNDFLEDGSLAVPKSNRILPVINDYVRLFVRKDLPIIATRDWHPEDHSSFADQGGMWPSHCIAGTNGAAFSSSVVFPGNTIVISKADTKEKDAYSGFEGTDLTEILQKKKIERLFLCGLATDYCVLATALDARRKGFAVVLLQDAVEAVNVNYGDGEKAIQKMIDAGVILLSMDELQ